MPPLVRLAAPLAVVCLVAGCVQAPQKPVPILAEGALVPSPRLIVGRVIAVDAPRGFVIVELAADAPVAATTEGAELIARTLDLRETARLRATRQLRGRMLGTRLVAGQSSPGEEVVWLAP